MHPIHHALIVGGVHGNELNGIHLIKLLEQPQYRHLVERSHLSVSTLLANPQAVELGRRFVDMDLNRCFSQADLDNQELVNYEQQLAKTIDQSLKARQVDFLIDLHSTTANMGLTLILGSDRPLNLAIAAHLSQLDPHVYVLKLTSNTHQRRLREYCPLSLTLEAGPIAQGTLHAARFFQTQTLITDCLDYINHWNQGSPLAEYTAITVYEQFTSVDFPRDDSGDAIAMIHPDRHGQDYQPMHPGDPLFIQFDGTVLPYKGNETVYPVFVHESAYWTQGIAMYLTRRRSIPIPPL